MTSLIIFSKLSSLYQSSELGKAFPRRDPGQVISFFTALQNHGRISHRKLESLTGINESTICKMMPVCESESWVEHRSRNHATGSREIILTEKGGRVIRELKASLDRVLGNEGAAGRTRSGKQPARARRPTRNIVYNGDLLKQCELQKSK